MTGAILKLQYKKVGQDDLSGMIIGCFFFVSKNVIATCHHVLNKSKLAPEKPFNHCVHYILFENESIQITDEMITEFPEVDLVFIHLKKPYNITIPKFYKDFTPISLIVESEAYDTTNPSFMSIGWKNNELLIESLNLDRIKINYNGYVTGRDEINWEAPNIQGIQLKHAKCVVLNYGGQNGASGSALFSSKTKELIGMIWGGTKDGSNVKQFYAISSIEIADRMKKAGLTKPSWKFW